MSAQQLRDHEVADDGAPENERQVNEAAAAAACNVFEEPSPECSSGKAVGGVETMMKRLGINKNSKFMKDFDPRSSQRVTRKSSQTKQKKKSPRQQRMYDNKGRLLATGEDLCDCLEEGCPGCHFPCPKCRSCKCGHECRRNRKWCYDEVEIEGTGIVIKRKT